MGEPARQVTHPTSCFSCKQFVKAPTEIKVGLSRVAQVGEGPFYVGQVLCI